MHYLIDGYNLFFYLTSNSPTNANRKELIETLEKLTYNANLNTSIVFDSRSDVASNYASILDYESLQVIYSARDQSADEYIIEFIYTVKEPKTYCIVTNDNAIKTHVKERGARTHNIDTFIKLLKPKARMQSYEKKEAPLTEYENHALLEIFERRYNNHN